MAIYPYNQQTPQFAYGSQPNQGFNPNSFRSINASNQFHSQMLDFLKSTPATAANSSYMGNPAYPQPNPYVTTPEQGVPAPSLFQINNVPTVPHPFQTAPNTVEKFHYVTQNPNAPVPSNNSYGGMGPIINPSIGAPSQPYRNMGPITDFRDDFSVRSFNSIGQDTIPTEEGGVFEGIGEFWDKNFMNEDGSFNFERLGQVGKGLMGAYKIWEGIGGARRADRLADATIQSYKRNYAMQKDAYDRRIAARDSKMRGLSV